MSGDHPQCTCGLKHPALNRGLDLYGLSCRKPKHCQLQHFLPFLECGLGHVAGRWAWRGRWLGQEDMAELRPSSSPGTVLPLSLLSCGSREGGPSCTAPGVNGLSSGALQWVLFRRCTSTSPGGRCPQAGPTARSHQSVHRLVPPLTPTGLPRGTHSAFANLQNVFLSQLHLYICLFCISKACFLDKFINILAGALSPCKSLSPTHMPTLPARLHSCFSTCSSRVGDPVVVCLPRSLLLNLRLSLPSSLVSLSVPSSFPLLSSLHTLAKGQGSLHTPSNVQFLHPFTAVHLREIPYVLSLHR